MKAELIAAVAPRDAHALEGLHALARALDHLDVHPQRVAGAEVGHPALGHQAVQLLLLELGNQVHRILVWLGRRAAACRPPRFHCREVPTRSGRRDFVIASACSWRHCARSWRGGRTRARPAPRAPPTPAAWCSGGIQAGPRRSSPPPARRHRRPRRGAGARRRRSGPWRRARRRTARNRRARPRGSRGPRSRDGRRPRSARTGARRRGRRPARPRAPGARARRAG